MAAYPHPVPARKVLRAAGGMFRGRQSCQLRSRFDILTEYAASRGLAGTAIWGACRDVATALRLGYPMYSRGRFMRTGKDRVEVADPQVPIALGDVQVRAGDVRADV